MHQSAWSASEWRHELETGRQREELSRASGLSPQASDAAWHLEEEGAVCSVRPPRTISRAPTSLLIPSSSSSPLPDSWPPSPRLATLVSFYPEVLTRWHSYLYIAVYRPALVVSACPSLLSSIGHSLGRCLLLTRTGHTLPSLPFPELHGGQTVTVP